MNMTSPSTWRGCRANHGAELARMKASTTRMGNCSSTQWTSYASASRAPSSWRTWPTWPPTAPTMA
eukprot:12893042-Alexandrium_andersonii.AAC.1